MKPSPDCSKSCKIEERVREVHDICNRCRKARRETTVITTEEKVGTKSASGDFHAGPGGP